MLKRFRVVSAAVIAAMLNGGSPVFAQQATPEWMRGLDELMSVEVSSVSKKEQRLADTSAAVYVLTREEIHRSGMRTVPEVLRLVPGLNVAQIDGNKWAVSARGMNARFSNKLLVMIDGRSIYTPYFAGVFWDEIDVPVTAIERIEVIRGPGASIWGANAVNGVINIITMGPAIRRDTVVSAGGGDANFGSMLHEGRAGDRTSYRLFADMSGYQALTRGGLDAQDGWTQGHLGGSVRTTLNDRDTVEGAVRVADMRSDSLQRIVTSLVPYAEVIAPSKTDANSWSASTRWTRELERHGQLLVEAFVDRKWREEIFDHRHSTIDVGVQHRIGVTGRHDVIWGTGYRESHERSLPSLTVSLTPEAYTHRLANVFAQDDITLFSNRAHLVLGTKVEYRDQLGWAAQPTARLNWRFTPRQSAWTAVSRAMRAPDRIDRAMQFNFGGFSAPGQLPVVIAAYGNPDLGAEWLTAFEAGYRAVLFAGLTLDAATFYNRYSDLKTNVQLAPIFQNNAWGQYLVLPISPENLGSATSAGGEAVATYSPQRRLKFTGSYALFTMRTEVAALPSGMALPPTPDDGAHGSAPRHQGQLRTSASVARNIDVDATLFAVGAIRDIQVPAYTRMDARIAWRPGTHIELSLVGQNLFGGAHSEFGGQSTNVAVASAMRRSGYGSVAWRF
jgi:iron complex outermembrane receptor protein